MLHITDLSERLSGPSAVTIGKFDGVHRGHRKLLETVLEKKKQGLTSCMVSFFSEPKDGRTTIYTKEEQKKLVSALDVDVLAQFTLDEAFRNLSAERFVKEVLCETLQAKVVVTGEDFRFGKDRAGDVKLLQALSKQFGYETICVPKVELGGARVSSTRIRELLSKGAVEEAGELLGQPYFVQGEVVHGKKLGRTLGFPTINVLPSAEKLLPAYGVYITRTSLDGTWYRGITNVGLRPTVKDEKKVSVETYLADYNGDLYGKTVTTEFLRFVRPERKFDGVEELKAAVQRDIAALEEKNF